MKITIEGSPRELAELAKVLNGGETAAEKMAELPLLLTDLSEDEKIKELAEAIRNVGKENAPQAVTAEQGVPFIPFLVRNPSNRGHRKRIKQMSCVSENHMNDNG